MSIVLQSTSGGSVTINEPTTASNFTQTLPAGTGTVVVSGINSAITAGTALASTSGTSITFTDIPSWAKRITVMFNAVSTNGSSAIQIQLGTSSGIEATAYTGAASNIGAVVSTSNNSTGFKVLDSSAATVVLQGKVEIALLNSNIWVQSGILGSSDAARLCPSGGAKTLSGTLDRVRITTVNGTDTFDAGSINILYE